MHKLYLRFLIRILHLLMDIRQEQTHSQYAWTKEWELIQEAQKVIKET